VVKPKKFFENKSKTKIMAKKKRIKKSFIPQGIPGATPCKESLAPKAGNAPKNFVPAGVEIKANTDTLVNFLIGIFANTKMPPINKKKQ